MAADSTQTDDVTQHPWFAMAPDDVADRLDVDVDAGLTDAEAEQRRDEYGENVIEESERTPAWKLLVQQFTDPLVVILIIAAAVAGAVGDLKDPIVIAVVLTLNAGIGFYQEKQAQSSMAALTDLLTFTARVRRDGSETDIDGAELVPGDVVLLSSGSRVPADGRIVSAKGLQVEEAALTGESAAVEKDTEAVEESAQLAERSGNLYMNTTIARGEAVMVVTATGMDTEVGQIAAKLREKGDEKTPLQQQLQGLTTTLAIVAGIACAALMAIGLAQGDSFSEVLLDAVALAVAAIPEGLPAVVTVTLAVGMNQMAKRNAIVKRLASVETLGSTTVICTDKTGTLTLNQMTAREVVTHGRTFSVSGEGYSTDGSIGDDDDELPHAVDVMLPVVLCSDASVTDGELDGEPTEGALLVVGAKVGIDPDEARESYPRINTIAFDSSRKYMATFHVLDDDEPVVLVKGAPNVLLDMCASWWGPDGKADFDDAARSSVEDAIDELSEQGRRVLAVASRALEAAPEKDATEDQLAELVEGLHLQAVVGIVDPARPEAAEAVERCKDAGIIVKMITGDHKVTAAAIAADLGIDSAAMDGAEFDELNDDDRIGRVHDTGVFARVSPQHKVEIVEALRADGEIVAMTGDGVNDAAAMKASHIGVAMGDKGSDVAKEAGQMVLTDDNFATIVNAVERGRAIYDNIVAFVRFQLSTNFGAIITILGARMAGLPTPFSPVQILWVNLIMDGPPALALGVDPPSPDTMQRDPRDPDAKVLDTPRLLRLLLIGAVMAAGTLGVFWWARSSGKDDTVATTLAFTTFVAFQIVNAFNARSETQTAFRRYSLSNKRLLIALVTVAALQVVVVQVPFMQPVFDTTSLTLSEWGVCAAVGVSVLVVEEIRKLIVRAVVRR